MGDLVKQLRDASQGEDWPWMGVLLEKAADEIAALKKRVKLRNAKIYSMRLDLRKAENDAGYVE